MNIDSEDDDELFLDHLDTLREKTLVQLNSSATDGETTKRKKKFVANFEVDGVVKVTLDESIQTSVGVFVGVDVTGEQPWKIVKKELLFDTIAVLGDDSPFSGLKPELEANEEEEILMGYIPDETNDRDEYYVCLTPEAKTHCEAQAAKLHKKQSKKLERAINKTGKPWKSLGSENEVDETILKNGRPLIKVEIKTKYPRQHGPKKFKVRSTDDIEDAYTELVPGRIKFENVYRSRIDFAAQAVPETVSCEAQTIPKFPENVWTQCSIDDVDIEIERIDVASEIADDKESEKVSETVEETLPDAEEENLENDKENEKEQDEEKEEGEGEEEEEGGEENSREKKFSIAVVRDTRFDSLKEQALALLDIVKFNSVIDLYNVDYQSLIKKDDVVLKCPGEMRFVENDCFVHPKTKGRIVSSVAWHPMWSGILAVAYSEVAHYSITNVNKDKDEVLADVYGYNAVLVWSVDDSLNPKLYLESTREVRTVSFCPFEDNILMGGCVNGQVVLWDLKDKLDEAEKIEVFTEEQEKCRAAIHAQVGWPKKINDKTVVRQTAISNLRKSHSHDVTQLVWSHPNTEILSNGKISMLKDTDERSLQFLSISLDGCILIWSLKISNLPKEFGEEEEEEGNFRVDSVDSSPYRVLNRKLEPVYRITIGSQGKVPLTSLVFGDIGIKYDLRTIVDATGRKLFSSFVRSIMEDDISQIIWSGSLYGEFFKISWTGQGEEIDPSVNTESCKFISKAIIHDGSVVCIVRNHFCKSIFATVGGKVFAIWTDSLLDRPLLWKRMNYGLTGAAWSTYKPSQIFITTDVGNVDVWDFMHSSDSPTVTQVISGKSLMGIYVCEASHDEKTVAIADVDGSLRMFSLSSPLTDFKEIEVQYTKEFFDRELKAKEQYYNWERAWYAKHADVLERNRKEEQVRQREKERKMKIEARKEQERREIEEERLRQEKKKVITPQEKWRKMQWIHAVKTIQEKKRLDKMELLKQVKPLRELEEASLSRQREYVEMLQNRKKIFDEAVAILFPEVVPKSVEPEKLMPIEEIKETRRKTMEDYERLADVESKFIEDNPFKYEFKWDTMMMEGKSTRRSLDVTKGRKGDNG